ncbi:DUF4153 domain-containing protein [Riemerella anatipestifer]|uniref:DUF4153 domain-containing protein n=1 Tax=Riemerella anatipestifer TaxID=34085 RepID=A0AAP6LJP6_RIEAN|nr:DUF4153 domain-containing protein [Riemerella anatipestifer]MBT0548840.1 DUF4153 domain-containing protein [Riemerella anatipestifer]MBT0555153.1 DUF4153 domain-containing protein [Riemerella anatipestifer]MBT0559603.1 DUF4153 domain-containing protein [Riemerella anatipestifer]MCD5968127.1 DUF4153 domain-containing protein [Riemerella anatipestifer]MCU7539686.1 DUF4153 domain-containing protein [Riemerella anatipestifer]
MKLLNNALKNLKKVVANYPMVLLSALISYIAIITAIIWDTKSDFVYNMTVIAFVSATGIGLFFSLKKLSDVIGKKRLLNILGVVLLVGYYATFPDDYSQFENFTFIIIPVAVIIHLFISVAPFLPKVKNEYSFWNYNKNLFVNFVLSSIFSGVLTAGILSAINIFNSLFGINGNYKIYPILFSGISILGNTIIFLLFEERRREEERTNTVTEFPIALKFFTQYILIPLLFIYLVMMYLYAAKIIFLWELPKGLVSITVISYSLVGIFALLLVHPLKNENSKSWVKWFSKIFYFSLVPMLVLLFVAIFTRLFDYGVTESRYFVLLTAIWITLCTFYFIFRKKTSISFIPKSLIAFLIFALIFPYFNVFSVSKRSQLNRLHQVLSENGLLVDGKINFNKVIKRSVFYEISDTGRYLINRNAKDELAQYLDEKHIKNLNKEFPSFVEYDDFTTINDETGSITERGSEYKYFNLKDRTQAIPFDGKGWILSTEYDNNAELTIENKSLKINSSLLISLDNKEVNFAPDITEFAKNTPSGEVEEMAFTKNLEGYRITIYINRIDYNVEKEEVTYANIKLITIQKL